jgi:hypothetical protein
MYVSTTLAKLVAKFAAGVIDTGGKFAAGVVDTGGNFDRQQSSTNCVISKVDSISRSSFYAKYPF